MRVDADGVALLADAEDILDARLVSPRSGAGIPRPAAAAGVLRVAVDVGSHTVRLDLVLEHVGERLCAVDGVDERIEVVGDVETALLELRHDVPHGAVCVLATVLAHADGVVHDVAGRRLRVAEGGREELYDLVLAVDEAVVGLAEDGGFLLGCSDIGEDAPSLADEVDLALGVVAAAHGVAVVVVCAEEPGAVPGGMLYGVDELTAVAGEFLAIGEVGIGHELRQLLHLGQQVGEEEGHPDALALALDTYGRHTVVPVAATHQREAMDAATRHSAVDGTAQVLVKRRRLVAGAVVEAALVLAGKQLVGYAERHLLDEDGGVAGDMHILVGHEDEPEVVVAEGGAGAEMEALVPPVEHIAFGELMGRMVENLAACVCRVAIEDRHDVLQLVAETGGTTHLIEAGAREEARGVDLI